MIESIVKSTGGVKNVKTLDLAKDLSPDYVGDVRNLSSLVEEPMECILCCQVLEHLPFEYFESCVRELFNVSNKYCIISLPHLNWSFRLLLKLFNKQISKQYIFSRKNIHFDFDGEHYWEIGARNASIKDVENILRKYFNIRKCFNVREKTYHRFYILEKL